MKTEKHDGFYNALSSVGTTRDQGTYTRWSSRGFVSKQKLDEIYAENALFARIIDMLPDDGTRRWIDFNHDKADEINMMFDDLGFKGILRKALKRERLHGGCAILVDADDGQELDQPLNHERIRAINKLQLFESDYIWPDNYNRRTEPEFYMLNSPELVVRIHKSRLIVFPGIEVSHDYKHNNNGWGEAFANRILPAIERREMVLNNIASLSGRMIIPHWGIDGLAQMVDSNDEQSIKARMESKLTGESLVNAVVTDTMDKFEMMSLNLSGLEQLLAPCDRDIIQASGLTHTKVFGESPGASLGANGGSQERDHHKTVASYQEDKIRGPIQQMADMITALLKTDWLTFDFNPLDEPSLKDMAEVHLTQARADQIYESMGVLDPVEIRESRFRNGYSVQTILDDQAYQAALELDALITEETPEI